MNPIFLILYAVLLTIVLTLTLPRMRSFTPGMRRVLAITAAAGVVVLIVLLLVVRLG